MKHIREILKGIKAELPGVEIVKARSRVHAVYELRYQGRVRHLAVAVSPKNTGHCVVNTVNEAKKLFTQPVLPGSPHAHP